MKNTFYILLLSLFVASCSTQNADHSGFSVKGKIEHYHDKTITLSELTPKGLIFIDTATVAADGSFELTGAVSEKTFCAINLPNSAIILVLDSASEIAISIDADKPETYGLNGSPESEELRKLLQINNTYMTKMRAIETKYAQYGNDVPPQSVQDEIRKDYDSIMSGRTAELQEYALEHGNTLVPYFATNFLMPESDFEFLEKIDHQLFTKFSSSKYAQEHHVRVEKLRKTADGQTAPDFVLADPFGKQIALSSLRGKYILVDFWASWCRPCREESPNLVKMYNKYKSMDFDIISVSLDDNKEAWTKAINDDHLLWNHVSDLKKWNSIAVEQYNIEAIPFTVLLNKDGKIIAKNLRGAELEKKLDEAIKMGL